MLVIPRLPNILHIKQAWLLRQSNEAYDNVRRSDGSKKNVPYLQKCRFKTSYHTIHAYNYTFIHLSIHVSIHSSISWQSIHPTYIHTFMHPYIHTSYRHTTIPSSIYPPCINTFICPSIHPYIPSYFHIPVYIIDNIKNIYIHTHTYISLYPCMRSHVHIHS